VNSQLSRADQLEKRLITFAVAILSLPQSFLERRKAVISAARSSAPEPPWLPTTAKHVRRKPQDFIHKLRIVFKELNETTIWLEVITESSMLSPDITAPIVAENRELCRVIAASIKSAT
jgi:hypothetical protein